VEGPRGGAGGGERGSLSEHKLAGLFRENAVVMVVLVASASSFAAPAAIRHAIPKASPGIYIPMALAVTFRFNITIGLPLYWELIRRWIAAE
jgi:uncharacterized protein